MAELGLAASVAGLISLSITAFQGCVRGIHLISIARSMQQDTDRLRSIFEWEEFRLLSWGERAGLMSEHSRPSPQLNWTIIYDFLKQLETLLTDTETLAAQYNLRIADQANTRDDLQEPPKRRKNSHFIGLWAEVKPELSKIRASIIRETGGAAKRLVWTTLDQNKLKALLSQIGMRDSPWTVVQRPLTL